MHARLETSINKFKRILFKVASFAHQNGVLLIESPIVNGLDVFGDKWTLVIIRDLFCGKNTYSELVHSSEKIPTNRLAERLKMLESENMLVKELYRSKPKRYKYLLTSKGLGTIPILQAIAKWGSIYTLDNHSK